MADTSDNPFLITPPPGLLPQRQVPDAPAETDSATHRIAASPASSGVAPAPTFFVAPIGMPPRAQPEAAQPASAAATAETRVSAPDGAALVLPDGSRHPLTSTVLIGRNPALSAEWPNASLLAVVDPAKTVSKTHAVIEVEGDHYCVRDLHSTNGVAVTRATGERELVDPSSPVDVARGDSLSLGDFALRLD